jgi:hypothetical protein
VNQWSVCFDEFLLRGSPSDRSLGSCFCHTRCCLSVPCVAVGRLRGDNPPGAALSVQLQHPPSKGRVSDIKRGGLGSFPELLRQGVTALLPTCLALTHSHGGSTSRRIGLSVYCSSPDFWGSYRLHGLFSECGLPNSHSASSLIRTGPLPRRQLRLLRWLEPSYNVSRSTK